MSDAVLGYPRRRLARFALVAVLGIGCLAGAPAALASPTSAIGLHVQRADVALQAAASASASGSTNIAVPLSKVTEQLGVAAKLGVRLGVHARTPKTEGAAKSALNLIAGEEAKAQAVLNAGVSAAGATQSATVVKADLAVTEGHALTLDELARVHGTARIRANALLRAVANLKVKAGSLLAKLVLDTVPNTVGCPSATAFAQLATKESSDIAATLNADVAGGLANVIDAGGSLLASLTADQAAQARARVNADLGCQPRDSGSGSAAGSPSGSGSNSGSGTSGGDNASGGDGVTGQVGAGAGVTGQVGVGAGLGASGSTNISGKAGVSAGLGLGLGRRS